MNLFKRPFYFLLLIVLLAGCAGRPSIETSDQGLNSRGLSMQRALIISNAKSMLGVPYAWGGNNPQRGLDCSGLAEVTYRSAGYSIPRTSNQQYQQLPKTKVARPGDLMFFGSSSNANHVGIYIGNQQMIHAPGRGRKVQTSNVGYGYWKRHYLGAASLAP